MRNTPRAGPLTSRQAAVCDAFCGDGQTDRQIAERFRLSRSAVKRRRQRARRRLEQWDAAGWLSVVQRRRYQRLLSRNARGPIFRAAQLSVCGDT